MRAATKRWLASPAGRKAQTPEKVLRMVRDGMTTREIARVLDLSTGRINVVRKRLGVPAPRSSVGHYYPPLDDD